MLARKAMPCDGSGRVLRDVIPLVNSDDVLVVFENAATVTMSREDFVRYSDSIQLAGRN